MSSSEEYLENLLQSMLNGESANPPANNLTDSVKQKSAIEMLTGEEPEQAPMDEIDTGDVMGTDDIDAMFASMESDFDMPDGNAVSGDEATESKISMMDDLNDDFGLGLDMDYVGDESGTDELSLDDLTIDDMGLDDMSDGLALEEMGLDDMSDGLALEEPAMDDDFAEINNLLNQSGQEENVDDEMLALLESVSDSSEDGLSDIDDDSFDFFQDDMDEGESVEPIAETQEGSTTEKKKKERKPKKEKKAKKRGKDAKKEIEETDAFGDIDSLVGMADVSEEKEEKEIEKKPGFFARMLTYLTEEEEEEDADSGDDLPIGEPTDENKELLEELSAEDKRNKKAKDNKGKKNKKDKKGKKDKNAPTEEGSEEEIEDSNKSAKKKKKPKKEKKKKEADEISGKEDFSKKISKKKIIPVILFCITITVVIVVLSSVIPDYLQERDARIAYDTGNYEEAYELLFGKNLSEEDEAILNKSIIILKLERKLKSYQNYQKIGNNELEALDALVQGAALYYELLPAADKYRVTEEVSGMYQQILAVLSEQYGLSETDVMEIIASEDDVTYTEHLMAVVYGISFADGIGDWEQSEAMQDILPEEQEIIDGMEIQD